MVDWLFYNQNDDITEKLEAVLENRRRWIGALFSGDYEQGDGYLCKGGKFCCLGVAAEVLKNDLDINITTDSQGIVHYDGQMTSLTPEMKEALGISDRDEIVLITLNDNGAPFKAIGNALDEMTPFVDGFELGDGDGMLV